MIIDRSALFAILLQEHFSDCIVDGLAQETGEPLLFKGEDFSKTDIIAVVYRVRSYVIGIISL